MYTISKESIQAIVQKAYEEGRLLAQNVKRGTNFTYYYRRGDTGCAIGVALPQEFADTLAQDDQLYGNRDVLEYDAWCDRLQNLHDTWANSQDYVSASEFKAHLYS